MRDILREPVQQKIILLVAIFFIAFVVLVTIDTIWSSSSREYEAELKNQIARRDLGRVIRRNLLTIEGNFYKLASADDPRDIDILEGEITDSVEGTKSVLGVLQSGGDFEDVIPANLEDVDEIRVLISFTPGEGYVVEAINLTPRILDLEDMTASLIEAVESKISASSTEDRIEAEASIDFLIKQAEALLLRSRESANKIFYDTNLEIERLDEERASITRLLDLSRFVFIVIVVVVGLVTFVITISQVRGIVEERAANLRELQAIRQSLEERVAERTVALEQRAVQLQAAAEVSRAAVSILESERLVQQAVELIQRRFGLYYVGLFLADEARQWAILRAGTGKAGQIMLERGHRIKVGEGMVGWSIAHSQPRVALEAGEDAVRLATAELPETRSEAALPLRSRGEVIGALSVQHTEVGAFDPDTLAVLQTMADQVAVALDNARLFAQSQEALEAERRAYGEISREAWERMVRRRAVQGYRSDQRGVAPSAGRLQPQVRRAVRAGQVVVGEDGETPAVSVPIPVRDQVVGALNFCKASGDETWTDEELALLQGMAEQLGQALDSARLYQDTLQREAQERLVGEVTGRIRETLDMDTVLQTAVREIGDALNLAEIKVRMGTGAATESHGSGRSTT